MACIIQFERDYWWVGGLSWFEEKVAIIIISKENIGVRREY